MQEKIPDNICVRGMLLPSKKQWVFKTPSNDKDEGIYKFLWQAYLHNVKIVKPLTTTIICIKASKN